MLILIINEDYLQNSNDVWEYREAWSGSTGISWLPSALRTSGRGQGSLPLGFYSKLITRLILKDYWSLTKRILGLMACRIKTVLWLVRWWFWCILEHFFASIKLLIAIIINILPVPMAREKTVKSYIWHVHPGHFFLIFSNLKISTTKNSALAFSWIQWRVDTVLGEIDKWQRRKLWGVLQEAFSKLWR